VNDQRMSALMREVAREIVGDGGLAEGVRTMGGEDMSVYLSHVPGCFAFVGSARPGGAASPHHSPTFDIDEDALVIGAELLTRTALRFLER
jgi:amidohydrolase